MDEFKRFLKWVDDFIILVSEIGKLEEVFGNCGVGMIWCVL